MKSLVCLSLLAVICTITRANSGLTILGPDAPVLEGEDVVLECVSDNDTDMRNYTFQKYSSWMKTWVQLDSGRYLRCWYFSVNITRDDGRLFMQLSDINEWQNGPYRCVKSGYNDTSDYVSENFTVSVIYLQDIYLQKSHSWYTGVSDVLWVEEGSTVEVKCSASSSQEPIYEWSQEFSDWILPSDTLTIRNVNEESEGKYICLARHPDMFSLVKTKSFQLKVMLKSPEQVRAFSTSLNFSDILLYIAIPGVMLTVLMVTMFFIILRHRRQQLRKPQISLVDGEKRTPIYKGSLQSVHSTTSDTQPLVM